MILNDFECAKHGVFEGSHAICPAMGCASESVKKVMLKAPSMKSDYTKRFDAGMKKSADMYGQSDWKTAREGESAKANNRSNELMWGSEATKFLGGNLDQALPRSPADGVPALGMVQSEGAAHKVANAERTMDSAVAQSRDRQKLIQAAKEATTK